MCLSLRSNSQERGRRSKRGLGKRGRTGSGRDGNGRDSGASSPDSFTSESAPKRGRKKGDNKEYVSYRFCLVSNIHCGFKVDKLILS